MKLFSRKIRLSCIIYALFSAFFLCLMLWNFSSAYQEILIENRGWHPIRVIKVVLDWEHFVVSSVAKEWWETIQSLTKKVWWISSINW
jgi:hypothetical protein